MKLVDFFEVKLKDASFVKKMQQNCHTTLLLVGNMINLLHFKPM